MSQDRGAADRLNDHLDVVATGGAARSHDLDPTIAATVERFFAADDAPGPPPSLADHLWQELIDTTASVERGPLTPGLRPHRNGRTPMGLRQTTLPNRGPSALAYLATAALVLLTLVGGFVALRGSLRLMDPEQRTIIPAIDSTAESRLPSGVIADDILLRATLEQMPPSGGTHQLGMYRARLAPSAEERAGSQADTGVGIDLFTVESGQVTVEADAPVFLTRAVANPADPPSPVPAGTSIVLDVGDQLLAPSGVTFRRRNDGSAPVTLLGFQIGNVGESTHTWSNPPGVTYVHGLPYTLPPEWPNLPADAIMHRLTLAPGAELPIRDLPGLELVYVEVGTLDLVYAKAETAATPELAFTIRAESGTDTFGRTPEKALLTNRGAEPLILLTASVVPASAGEATSQSP
jgi:hypothetical protein